MAVEYDLVILGGTIEGRVAAARAARYGARVALIEPPGLFQTNQQQKYLLSAIQQADENAQCQQVNEFLGSASSAEGTAIDNSKHNKPVNWLSLIEWSAIAAETQMPELSVAVLNAQGVDVILEMPNILVWQHKAQRLIVTSQTRQLRSRAVLAAFGRSPDTLQRLLTLSKLPKKLSIAGGNARAVQWAQGLASLGTEVVIEAKEILPAYEKEIGQLMCGYLSSLGVTVADSAPTQTLKEKTDCTLHFNHVQPALLFPRKLMSPVDWRNSDVYPDTERPYLKVNRRLQTRWKRIFACGSITGGPVNEAIACYQAKIATDNALFWPTRVTEPPIVAQSHAQFARVGLSEEQAQQYYKKAVRVWSAGDSNSTDLSQLWPQSAYCKLVCIGPQVAGIHLFGKEAGVAIQPMTAFIDRPLQGMVDAIDSLSGSGLMRAIAAAANQAQQSQWQPGNWKRNWAENWFNWRRSCR